MKAQLILSSRGTEIGNIMEICYIMELDLTLTEIIRRMFYSFLFFNIYNESNLKSMLYGCLSV